MLLACSRLAMIISCGNTKGGIGKITLGNPACLVAGNRWARRAADRCRPRVVGSGRHDYACEGSHSPPLACVPPPDGGQVRAQLAPLAGQHVDIVINAGGREGEALCVAMVRSDLLIVPV